jgi:uncharacterized protein
MMAKDATYWVEKLGLLVHPEGGYFRETYRASEQIDSLPDRFKAELSQPVGRSCSTGIYFLLESGQFSAFHRIKSDEMWHFYTGSSLTVYGINPAGQLVELLLGSDPEQGETWQAVVPAGWWFSSRVNSANTYALVGCTVAPGFDFADFELAERSQLLQAYPQHQTLIEQLTHA